MKSGGLFKEKVKGLVSPVAMGVLDYFRFPERRESWGGPLNGQIGRQKIVEAVFREFSFAATVETGTFRGTTTRYLAKLGANKIYTIEADPRNYGFALASLNFVRGVKVLLGDSRAVLKRRISAEVDTADAVFFYLDAHWNDDLPLKEELETIFSRWERAVVCIDDFRVDDDAGYGFDDYGPGKTLELAELRPILQAHVLSVFFPGIRADDETGAKRGSVFLAKDVATANRLASVQGLRYFCRGREC